jgi:hypothetical protein
MDPLFLELPPLAELPGLNERYQDLKLLGEGSSARVYQATDMLLLRPVALKVLKANAWAVLQEGRAQAKVEHPNVCRIYEVGRGFLVMELIDGPPLQTLRPGLSLAQKVAIVRDVALGVHAAHQRSLIHLDLKPGNILVRVNEHGAYHPVLSDFGMVLGTSLPPGTRCPMGTPPYSSPEQLRGDPASVDCRSDVYSAGMVLYVLLGGHSPFPAGEPSQLLEAIADRPPTPLRTLAPDVPPDLACLVHRCLAKSPADRYPTALRLAEDLDRFLQGNAVEAMPWSIPYRSGKWLRRNRWLAMLGAVSALTVLGVSLATVRRDHKLAEREDWDHHFQLLVEDLRASLDRCYRKPIHDVEPERTAALRILQTIETDMRASPTAAGPGNLALGQALLILSPNNPKAQEHFQKAWDLGYRTEGARAWLAYALVTRHQDNLMRLDARSGREGADNTSHLLDQARQLLAGRTSTEQKRVAHLLDLAELGTTDPNAPGKSNRALQLARAYRKQFPDDLEAMLEEANAAYNRAVRLDRLPSTCRPPIDGDPAVLIREAEALARSILTYAPSHPEGYRILARILVASERILPRPMAERRALHGEIGRLFDQGYSVAPRVSELEFDRLEYICTSRLLFALEAHRVPEIEGFLKGDLKRTLDADGYGNLFVIFHALSITAQTLQAHECPSRQMVLDAAAILLAHRDRFGSREAQSFLASSLSAFAGIHLEAGGDPRVFQAVIPELGPRQGWTPEADARLSQDYVILEYQRRHGLDPTATLAEARELLSAMKLRSDSRSLYHLGIAEAAARAWDTLPAWEEFDKAIKAAQDANPLTVDDFILPTLVRSQFLLARHDLKVGASAEARLQAVDEMLASRFSCLTRNSRLHHAFRAERLLLGSFLASPAPAFPALKEAIHEINSALEPLDPRTEPLPRFRGTLTLADYPLKRADLHLLRGEILLRAAAQAPGAAERARDRALGLAALHRAVLLAPDLAPRARRVQEARS